MNLSIGSDHAGFKLKQHLVELLIKSGYITHDKGCFTESSCDYPDYAKLVCEDIILGKSDKGILICGSGIGMSIAANRISNIRAALCFNEEMARKSRLHNDANILVLGANFVSLSESKKMVDIFLNGQFEGGRHLTRLNKIS